ncbi:MAG: lactate utilization protein, partial [Clostridia bacterium]|nr:lactate utilization protein [Clostridia bacterium]
LKANLINNGYKVSVFENKEQATNYLNTVIDGKTVGIGGSVTVNELGLYDALKTHNNVIWHLKVDKSVVKQTRLASSRAEVYISSVNAISMQGELVNIDATGNRVAATTFGPNKIYFIIGKNKIVNSLEDAVYRARNVASPLNAKRLGFNTPCAIKGDKCYNCNSAQRICKALSIFLKAPNGADYEIILVNENLGF